MLFKNKKTLLITILICIPIFSFLYFQKADALFDCNDNAGCEPCHKCNFAFTCVVDDQNPNGCEVTNGYRCSSGECLLRTPCNTSTHECTNSCAGGLDSSSDWCANGDICCEKPPVEPEYATCSNGTCKSATECNVSGGQMTTICEDMDVDGSPLFCCLESAGSVLDDGTAVGNTGSTDSTQRPSSQITTGLLKSVGGNCSASGTCAMEDVMAVAIDITKIMASIIGSIALLFFIFAGIKMLFSGGNPQTVTSAKAMMAQTMIGIVIFLAAYLIVDFVQKQLLKDPIEMEATFSNQVKSTTPTK